MKRDKIAIQVTYESTLRLTYDVEVDDDPGWEERAKAAASKRREDGDEADGWDEGIPHVYVER